ncbi:uncharacterized protein METZ01_LOCUS291052 [marine metagenome]|uniref:Transketolase N-terminal domain-containing protein n=1 Tax=marine metagenome TaxID=408172 RepID=A0A382LN86_9ZZZZ
MLDEHSKLLRQLVLEMVEVGRRGHIGSAMSSIEIIRVIYDSFLQFRSEEPNWSERDRFILSKGHGCLALYAVLANKGFFDQCELRCFCMPESILGGHPERNRIPGVEASTGSLGHGLPIGVGMALAAKIRKQSHRVVVVTGDGEINEGSVWEAALSAAKHKLSNLIVFVDHNKQQSYGPVSEVLELAPLLEKWHSFGFEVSEVDGHNIKSLEKLMDKLPLSKNCPTAIICNTIKGRGIPKAENNPEWHHKSRLSDEDIQYMRDCLI